MRPAGQSGSAAASALRMGLLLMLGLVLLGRTLEYMNDRISDVSRGSIPAARAEIEAATRAAEADAERGGDPAVPLVAEPPPRPQPAARVLPPPPDTFVHALQTSDRGDRQSALRLLRSYASTPEVRSALAVAATSAASDWDRRYIACLRGRDLERPVAELFEMLPAAPPQDAEWRQEPVECLVETIAGRATEDPAQAGPLLAVRTLYGERAAFTDALVRLEPLAPPPDVVDAMAQTHSRPRRSAAVHAAVSLGAATTVPDDVRRWLDDADRAVRLTAVRALIRRGDGPSRGLAAAALASSPGDADLEALAMEQLAGADSLERELAAVAADPLTPDFARAQAIHLVSRGGGEAAARSVAALTDRDATVQPELAAAMRTVVRRFGARTVAR
jgi:hypothetical protein